MNASPFPGTRLPEPDGAPDTPGVNAELMRERAARAWAEAALHANEQALDKMAHDMRNQFNALASAVEVLKSADTKSSLGMRALAIIAR
ncbi:MAG: hypothetical protein ABI343_07520, partial [Burkholderiaceae bacterium]